MFNVGPWELVLILVIVLLVFGPGKLPEVGKYLGKGIKEFKRAVNSVEISAHDLANGEKKDPSEIQKES